MALKQIGGVKAPDGSDYVTITDGSGNLVGAAGPSGGQAVEGTVASGVADSGNPVKVGGKYNATLPTFVDGQRGDLQITSKGQLQVSNSTPFAPSDGTSNTSLSTNLSNSGSGSPMFIGGSGIFNGTTWDRTRSVAGAADASTATGFAATSQWLYNGSTFDRARAANGVSGPSSGTGVQVMAPIGTPAAGQGIISTATSAVASSIVLKASAGNLFSVNAVSGGSSGYLMVFDATSAPADGAVTPVFCVTLAANSTFFTDFEFPIRCSTGITLVFSTTGPFTKTASATAFLSGQLL